MAEHYLLVDISNTFTKIALATRRAIGKVERIPTSDLSPRHVTGVCAGKKGCIGAVSSVVPEASARISRALPEGSFFIGPEKAGGLPIEYPEPAKIGADRIANALACAVLHGKPAIVVDFGTAVTFDVISSSGAYVGGVIAPGLGLMAEYLHSRTALLPLIKLARPGRAVGKSTKEAMLSGAVNGYRGLVKEIIARIRAEEFRGRKALVVATGGDAELIGEGLPLFDRVDPLLTLRGLLLAAVHAKRSC